MAKVELKQPIVDEIKELLTDVQSAVLVSYRGITVEQDTAMRKELREAGVEYKVYKNTMIRFAIQGTEFEALADDLTGPTAIAVSKTDATAPARILAKHVKNVEVFLGSIQSPITNFARVIKQIAEKDGEGAAAE